MIIVRADTRHATCMSDDAITTGSVGIQVKFMLSGQFNGLSAVAVFRSTGASVDVALMSNTCVVPPEVLRASGAPLYIGVYARNSAGTVVIPTVWTATKDIQPGTRPSGVNPSEPTPDWTAQVQLAAQEAVQTSEQAIETSERAIEIAGGAQAEADDARQSADEAAASAAEARAVQESIPQDYSTLSENVDGLQSAAVTLLDLAMSGEETVPEYLFGEWGHGYVDGNTGNVVQNLTRRVCQYDIVSFGYAIPLTIKSGFMITVSYYNSGVYSSTDYNIVGNYTISADSEFRITIRRVTEDASEVANISEFLAAVGITSNILLEIDDINAKTDNIISKMVQFSPNPNLVDWTTIGLDTYLQTDGTTSANANNWTSDYIAVDSGTQYAYSFAADQTAAYLGVVVFYNANNVRQSFAQNVATFTTPDNCKYIRMCRQYHSASGTGSAAGINSSNYLTADYYINKTNLQVGSSGTIPQNDYLAPNIYVPTWYKGKKILSYGDSIVELNTWQPHCRKYLGTDTFWNGGGVGGTTVYNNGGQVTFPGTSTPVDSWMCSDGRINRIKSIYPNADCIIVLAGHNDWSESCPIGEIGDTLVDSNFKSAYALMLKKLVEGFPNSRIICCTPINGRVQTAGVNQDVQMKNQLGLCITDYANAVIDVCRHYGIPCIDLNGETGISVLNAATYIGDVVHPNAAGGKLIANAVINGMTRFNPIAF